MMVSSTGVTECVEISLAAHLGLAQMSHFSQPERYNKSLL
jgi:hypothetical protein